ncbi:MAG TPA: SMP-30/gluconolactonase/LRE family protein [Labilithrix sp.]|jgi:sugar lactone lactonase YvrE
MKLLRLAFVFTFVSAAFAYACSSSSSDNGGSSSGTPPPPPGTPPPGTPPPGTPPPGNPPPPPPPADGGDAGEGGATCVGNPLTADGGDSGAALVGLTATTLILNESGLTARGVGNWFLDGVRYVDDGTPSGELVYSSFTTGAANPQLERVLPDGGGWRSLRDTSAGGGGLGIGNATKTGVVFTAFSNTAGGANDHAAILRTNPDGGGVATDLDAGPAVNMNHLVVGPKGDVYFTDARYQSALGATAGVYRMAPGGAVTAIETGATASVGGGESNRFNGIALSPDATKLYVSLTGSDEIRVYTVSAADGSVAVPANKEFVGPAAAGGALQTTDSPAGLAVDVGGNVWVAEANADPGTAAGRVEVYSPAGKLLGQIDFTTAVTRPTQVAFGGPNNTALFIATESSGAALAAIYKYSSRCAGVR